MPPCPGENDRIVRSHCIQIDAQRSSPFIEFVFGPAIAGDPFTFANLFDFGRDELLNFCNGGDFAQFDIALWPPADVSVRVVETGYDKFAAEINRLFGIKLFSQAAITGCHDQPVSDDQGVDQREGFISYENFAVGQNEISGTRGAHWL